MQDVYLDNAATTPIRKEVKKIMQDNMENLYGNPSSFHMKGKVVRDEVEEARQKIAMEQGVVYSLLVLVQPIAPLLQTR
jgi:cysteine desulfurase